MLFEDQHPLNKQIMIAVLGKPNAGKSSLVNQLLGFDLSIVTPKAQTTRNKFHCVFTVDRTEVVLVDTPGIHKSSQEMNKRMIGQAQEGVHGTDLNFILVDLSGDVVNDFADVVKSFTEALGPTWVIFNKSDVTRLSDEKIQAAFLQMKEILPTLEAFYKISAKEGDDVHLLTGAIVDRAQSRKHLYPDGEVSNKSERFFVSEFIREQLFLILREELPYECAVTIEEFKDYRQVKFKQPGDEQLAARISATIIVNRPSQRAIVIGRSGMGIKDIGTAARKKIEAMLQGQVYLNLHVKVKPKWFKSNFILEELGLPRVEGSARVWRRT
ncbi:MAG: GTPase Era [Bacteriovoracaceae bacterium]|nr:GTPase Era [Bacteriovoracaceae bacterium]